MTIEILDEAIAFIESLKAKLSPAAQADVKAVQNAGHEIVTDAVSYIETNGLQDLETIASGVLTSVATGTPWATILASVKVAGEAAGKSLAAGAVAVVTAKAQADLIAVGKLTPAA